MNILLTSVGRRSYLVNYFKEALAGSGTVHAANSSALSPAFPAADASVVTPLIYDDDYIPFLLAYCNKHKINAIISLFDVDLPVLSKNKKRFEEAGVTLVVSDPEVIDICNDKWKTYCFLTDNGFRVPKTFLDLNDAIDSVSGKKITYPLMVKPRWGMGSIAVYEADNELELKVFHEKAKRNILKSYLKYESTASIENSVLIQEKLAGQEYGLDIINDLTGCYQTTVCKMKYAMRSGETDCAVTTDNSLLKETGAKLSNCVHHIGNLDVDVFLSDNKPYILEMNARFGGGYPFSHMAGINLPKAIIEWLQGKKAANACLQERVNIMSQKDIHITRLHLTPEIKIVPEKNSQKIYEALTMLEDQLDPSLKERGVNIEAYADKLGRFGKTWLIIDKKQTICGMLSAYMNDMESCMAYLSFLAVKPEYRGLHLAEQLLNTAEEEAKVIGMKKFRLEVRRQNNTAIGFYSYLGYNITDNASDDSCYMEKIFFCYTEEL